MTDWRESARCRDATDPDLWFPIGDRGPAKSQLEHAKDECGKCPVWIECRQYALDTNQEFGVWGGLSEGERVEIARGGKLPARRRSRTDDATESALMGLGERLTRAEKRDVAQRMWTEGRPKKEIGAVLKISGATINEFLAGRTA